MPAIIIACTISHIIFKTINCVCLYIYPNSRKGTHPTQYNIHIARDNPAVSFVEYRSHTWGNAVSGISTAKTEQTRFIRRFSSFLVMWK